MSFDPNETVVSLLTPAGTGAIASLGIAGPKALDVVGGLFHPVKGTFDDIKMSLDQFYFGRFGNKDCADEVVMAVTALEPVPRIEIHAHGGKEIVQLLMEQIQDHGAIPVPYHQWLRQVHVPNLSALAMESLSQTTTLRTTAILLDQAQGAFEKATRSILDLLNRQATAEALSALEQIAQHSRLGRHLIEPWKVVLTGEPNVGKSSLINAMTGFQRAVVSQTPGTTRDLVSATLSVHGWPVELTDTAGIRTGATDLESAGIALTQQTVEQADLRLHILSATEPFTESRVDATHTPVIVNKMDLPPTWDLSQCPGALHVSALKEEGIEDIFDLISRFICEDTPAPGAAVPFTVDLCEITEQATEALKNGDQKATQHLLETLLEESP